MINGSKLKVVVFDFDDTLCIHAQHGSFVEGRTRNYFSSVMKDHSWWDSIQSKPSAALKVLIDFLKEREIPMYLCSVIESSIHGIRKVEWVAEKYGVTMSNLCVKSPEYKIDACVALADHLNVARESILIVDDYHRVIEWAENAGFQSATPIEAIEFSDEITK